MKNAYALLIFCMLHIITNAQHTQLPQIPDYVFTITDFGAVGDGKTLNTNAIQQALNELKFGTRNGSAFRSR